MDKYNGLKKQILYLIAKLENSKYFQIKNIFESKLGRYKIKIYKDDRYVYCILNKNKKELIYRVDFHKKMTEIYNY